MKESIFGSLSAFLKADNFDGKRKFIQEYGGLEFLSRQVCSPQAQEYSLRLKKKIMNLVNDFVLNDDSIFDKDPVFVRKTFGSDEVFMNQLLSVLDQANMEAMVQYQYREFILRAIFRIYQVNVDILKDRLNPVMYKLRGQITSFIE